VLAVYAGLARKRQPIYWLDTATGHQGPRYTCFVRAVFGVDRQACVKTDSYGMPRVHLTALPSARR
jgi:hypothetical protein